MRQEHPSQTAGRLYRPRPGTAFVNGFDVHFSSLCRVRPLVTYLPEGYDTVLAERGPRNLSGGEGQRICLARAFLKDAPVLIQDEPTSSVDSESERLIGEALHRLCAGRTVITISHTGRLLEGGDVVFRLDGGRVFPEGPVLTHLPPT